MTDHTRPAHIYPDVSPMGFLDVDACLSNPDLDPDGDGLPSDFPERLVVVTDYAGDTRRLSFTFEDARSLHEAVGAMIEAFDEGRLVRE
jgi:hypothetical protein